MTKARERDAAKQAPNGLLCCVLSISINSLKHRTAAALRLKIYFYFTSVPAALNVNTFPADFQQTGLIAALLIAA